jgi:hypothetical protein
MESSIEVQKAAQFITIIANSSKLRHYSILLSSSKIQVPEPNPLSLGIPAQRKSL